MPSGRYSCPRLARFTSSGLNRARALAAQLAAELSRPDAPCNARREWRSLLRFDQLRKAVAELPELQQRAIVAEVMRRELGVMALSALVVVFLALRAAGTAHGF